MKIMELYNNGRILLELSASELQHLRRAFREVNTIADVMKWLEGNGWERIGDMNTSYSQVYGKGSSPWIVKLFKRGENMRGDPSMRCGVQWLRYAQKNHLSNPHLPKVAYIQTIRVGGDTAYIAVIERLAESDANIILSPLLDMKDEREKAYYGASVAMLGARLQITADAMLPYYLSIDGNFEELRDWMNIESTHDDDYVLEMMKKLIRVNYLVDEVFDDAISAGYPLAKVIEKAKALSDAGDCDTDFHRGNIMIRPGTGVLVVTDPLHG